MMGFDFAPVGWAKCDGAMLDIAQNQALYSLIGPAFGGDGRVTFALPDLRGRVPVHQPDQRGFRDGQENVTLNIGELPAHTHAVNASHDSADSQSASDMYPGANSSVGIYANYNPSGNVMLNAATLSNAGNNQAHNNMQPSEVVSFCIALDGVYPSRN
jgi:microcystin-dependent protein